MIIEDGKLEQIVSVTRDVFPGNWEEMGVGGKFFGRDEKKIERGTTRKMAIKGEQSFENLIKVRTAAYTIESI